MRTYITVLILSMVSVLGVSGQNDYQFKLSLAEESYRNGNFAEAADKYRAIADSGMVSADLFFNLGNAYFKSHDYKSAILYYERARRLSPSDEDIIYNLNYARNYITDKTEEPTRFFLSEWANAFSNLLSERSWGLLNIAMLFFTLLCLGAFLLARSAEIRKWGLSIGFAAMLLFLVSFAAGIIQRHDLNRQDEAIVFVPALMVKSSPDEAGTNLFVLHEGTKVRVTDRVGQWCEIRLEDKVGWARLSEIEII